MSTAGETGRGKLNASVRIVFPHGTGRHGKTCVGVEGYEFCKKKTISQKALTIHASRVKNTLTCRKQAGYQFCHHNEYHLTRFVLVKLRSICHILIVIPSSCFIYILYDHIKGFIAKQNKNVYTRVSRNTYSFQVQIISPKRHGLQII